jgi:RNA polymerase sigma factor (sigma-70 family)
VTTSPDNAAISALLDQCRPGLRRVFRRWSLQPADAEDVVQQALLYALVQWPEIRNPIAWLPGTAELICRNRTRTGLYQECVGVDGDKAKSLSVAPEQHRWELLADLDRLSDELPPNHRQILALRFLAGMTIHEVAPLVGVRPGSVRKVVSRSLAAISARLRAGDQSWRRMIGVSWKVAVAEYLDRRLLAVSTTQIYRRHLLRAGETMALQFVREVSIPSLIGYRARLALAAGCEERCAQALAPLRSFMRWSGALGMHDLPPEAVRDVLAREPRSDAP